MARRTEYRRYTEEFKVKALALSQVAGVRSKDVAESLDIHPLMLSRWRKLSREGKISTRGKKIKLEGKQVAELVRYAGCRVAGKICDDTGCCPMVGG